MDGVSIAQPQAAEAQRIALEQEAVQKYMNGGQPRKIIFIPGPNGQEPKINIVV